MNEDAFYEKLTKIVGADFASNRPEELFLYSRDSGATVPRRADYATMPKTVEELKSIVLLAGEYSVPVVPLGGGLTLSALAVPVRGGVVLDLKRMDRIIEIDEEAGYALIEPGVTQGALIACLERDHPHLRHSAPDAPPAATVAGNALIYGSGHLSKYGAHSEMITGLETVLSDGRICRIGSCSTGGHWFCRWPLPDLSSFFLNWFGTTGIVTKLAYKLYPRHRYRDMIPFVVEGPDRVPEAIGKITATGMMEDVLIVVGKPPRIPFLVAMLIVYVTADTEEELAMKEEVFREMFAGFGEEGSRIIHHAKELFPPKIVKGFMEEPQYAAAAADFLQGGGFEYLGIALPVAKIPEVWRCGMQIAADYGFDAPQYTIRNIGCGHGVIFAIGYPFNRADEASMERSRKALYATNRMALKVGGVHWKPELDGQKCILDNIDTGARALMGEVKELFDPASIMNPGNWTGVGPN